MDYGNAGKASKMMGKGRSAKAANKPLKKKKNNRTKATEKKIKRLREAGMDEATINRLLDKGAR
jgi:hypothetical protein